MKSYTLFSEKVLIPFQDQSEEVHGKWINKCRGDFTPTMYLSVIYTNSKYIWVRDLRISQECWINHSLPKVEKSPCILDAFLIISFKYDYNNTCAYETFYWNQLLWAVIGVSLLKAERFIIITVVLQRLCN